MAKIRIAQNPTFNAKVDIPRIGGEPLSVEFTYRVLPRTELAALYDKWAGTAKSLVEEHQDDESFVTLAAVDVDLQVQQLKDILVGWSFEDEFDDDNLRALCDSAVGAAAAILDAYQKAYTEHKVKN